MLTARPVLRSIAARSSQRAWLSKSVAAPAAGEDDEDAVSPVTVQREKMTKTDPYMVWGKTGAALPAPVLPENPAEIASLDPVDQVRFFYFGASE